MRTAVIGTTMTAVPVSAVHPGTSGLPTYPPHRHSSEKKRRILVDEQQQVRDRQDEAEAGGEPVPVVERRHDVKPHGVDRRGLQLEGTITRASDSLPGAFSLVEQQSRRRAQSLSLRVLLHRKAPRLIPHHASDTAGGCRLGGRSAQSQERGVTGTSHARRHDAVRRCRRPMTCGERHRCDEESDRCAHASSVCRP